MIGIPEGARNVKEILMALGILVSPGIISAIVGIVIGAEVIEIITTAVVVPLMFLVGIGISAELFNKKGLKTLIVLWFIFLVMGIIRIFFKNLKP